MGCVCKANKSKENEKTADIEVLNRISQIPKLSKSTSTFDLAVKPQITRSGKFLFIIVEESSMLEEASLATGKSFALQTNSDLKS
ncbi:unnamed protein product [Blepharisma stoltei]|uniref:Uncharacterized protein n=1 Tax=Blepharisma stoltei TaxID=1481888 RepID=A0AAU9K3V2_9CILI|nr:unnamed protein product [Blepharisma stoltei]